MPCLRGGERHLAVIPAVRAVGSRCEDSGASLLLGCRRLTNRIDRGGFHGGGELRNTHITTHTKKPKKQIDFFFFFLFCRFSETYIRISAWLEYLCWSEWEGGHTHTHTCGEFQSSRHVYPSVTCSGELWGSGLFLKSLRLEKEQPSLRARFALDLIRD